MAYYYKKIDKNVYLPLINYRIFNHDLTNPCKKVEPNKKITKKIIQQEKNQYNISCTNVGPINFFSEKGGWVKNDIHGKGYKRKDVEISSPKMKKIG